MAWRAASCAAVRGLQLGRAVPAVSAASSSLSSSSSVPSLGILRSSCRSRVAAVKVQVHGQHTETTMEPKIKSNENEPSSMKWKIKMLYDGDCPLCMREVNMLRERNKLYGSIRFVDISSKDYSPEENEGLDYRTVMGRIHAILSDGTVVTDVEAFRRLYEEVGLGWIYAITKYKPIATVANVVYGVWAKYRLQITGRPPLEDILESRKRNMNSDAWDSAAGPTARFPVPRSNWYGVFLRGGEVSAGDASVPINPTLARSLPPHGDLGMARCGGGTVIVIYSSSSSSEEEEDEEKLYESAQKLKLRTQLRLFKCRGRKVGGGGEEDDDDDCVILEKDPFLESETEVARAIADLPRKLSLSSKGGGGDRKDDASRPQLQHGGEEEEEEEVTVVAARGEVALRDYPHSRHLCVKHPFGKTPHENYCDQCYCYVCDKPAPCGKWKDLPRGHCNATDQDEFWRKLRLLNRVPEAKVGLHQTHERIYGRWFRVEENFAEASCLPAAGNSCRDLL